MVYTINDLGNWLTQLLILESNEKKLRKAYDKTVCDKEVLYSDTTYLDSDDKIIAFQAESAFFFRKLNKLFKKLEIAREELKLHCLIIPKGPVFKIEHSTGTFEMLRKPGIINLQNYATKDDVITTKQIRYIFPDIITWNEQ